LDKNWENLKNRFKSPKANAKPTAGSKDRKWISKDLRYIPERSQSVIADGDARKQKKSKSKAKSRRFDILATS
jgi:hypothetical protein